MASLTQAGITFGDGTSQSTAAAASSYIGGRGQVFTGSGTFTVPAGVTAIKVTVIGGGGAGGASQSIDPGETGYGGGGGGGGTAIKYITDLAPGTGIAVTVGGSGGTSSFGSYCSATGGATGGFANARNTAGAVGGGTGSGGSINLPGGVGLRSGAHAGNAATIGTGGAYQNGVGSYSYGGGGGGAVTGGQWAQTGGSAGYQGVVIVEW